MMLYMTNRTMVLKRNALGKQNNTLNQGFPNITVFEALGKNFRFLGPNHR